MINKKSLFLIALIAIHLASGQPEQDENNLSKRISLLGLLSSAKPTDPVLSLANYSALPTYFTGDAKYQNNNDLLQILNLFTSPKTADAIINEFWHNHPTVETCITCNILIKHMIAEYKGEETAFRRFFFSVCDLIKLNGNDNQEFCTGFTEIYAPQLFYILTNTRLNSEEICATFLTKCLDHYHWYKGPLFWEVNISEKLDYAPNTTSKISQYMTPRNVGDESSPNEKKSPLSPASNSYPAPAAVAAVNQSYSANNYASSQQAYEETFEGARFLHLTDLHLDLLYSLQSDSYCGRILCCRKAAPPVHPQILAAGPSIHSTSQPKVRMVDPSGSYLANLYSSVNESYAYSDGLKRQAGYWGSYGNCDSPLRLIKHVLRHLSEFANQLDYIVYSGDSISHNIWSTNRQQVVETNEILFKLINKYLLLPKNAIKTDAYGKPMAYQPRRLVPVIGNHESDVVSMFPSTILEYQPFSINWLYQALYELWKAHIPADQVANFLKGGYYSVVIAKNMKLIVLNTNACYRLNFWTLVHNQDLDGQLAWLEQELYLAEKSYQNVHLIGHIAPDKETCNTIWLHNFIQIVTRYQAIIKAQFYGHSHLDEIRIYYGSSVKKIINARDAMESAHSEKHSEQDAESLLNQVIARSAGNQTEDPKQSKRIINSMAEQQIKQLIGLENLQKQLQHLNKDLLFKNRITLADKISGYHANPYPGYTKETKTPISIAFLTPSISPYDDVNPAYRVFIVDDTGYVANAKTFYADIEEANSNHAINAYRTLQGQPKRREIFDEYSMVNYLDQDQDPEYDEAVEMNESENQLSYRYAMPERSVPSYASSYDPANYPPKPITGNSYAQPIADYSPYKTQSKSVSHQPSQSKPSEIKKPKVKDYVESSTPANGNGHYGHNYNQSYSSHYSTAPASYNAKPTPSYSGYEQTPKLTYPKPQVEQPYHPVYEKYSVQPKSAKKYSTNQNSYQANGYQAKPSSYQQPPKSTGQYPQSNAVYNSQPESNYTTNPAKSYQPPPLSVYQPSAHQANSYNHQTSHSKDSKLNYVPSQPQPTYKNSYDHYVQSSIENYKPKYSLPADIEYEFQNYDEPKPQYDPPKITPPVAAKPVYAAYPPSNQPPASYQPSKPEYSAPKVQSSNYPPKSQDYSKPAAYPQQPASSPYQPNSYPASAPKSSGYQVTASSRPAGQPPAPQMQNYSKPLNYPPPPKPQPAKESKPTNNYKSIENKSNYQPPNSYHAQPASTYKTQTFAYTEKPPTAKYELVQYSKPVETQKYNQPPPSYPKPTPSYQTNSTSKYPSANAYSAKYTAPKAPSSNKYPTSQPVTSYPQSPYSTNYGKPANYTKPSASPMPIYSTNGKNYQTPAYNPPPTYQPISQSPKLEYDLANSYAGHPPSQPKSAPVAPLSMANYRSPTANHVQKNSYQPAPYQPAHPYGAVYENELGNRPVYPAKVPSERDYRVMKMKKEHKELKWQFEYDLNTDYSISKSTPYDWVKFVNLMRTDSALFERFYRHLNRNSRAERWKVGCKEGCRQHLLDDFFVIDPLDY